MIIGRTPAGLIKTKTDGGLRAVNCACCNTCPCALTIPQALRELVANATINTVTILGYSADFFYPDYPDVGSWYAGFYNAPEEVDFAATLLYDGTTGCLFSGYFNYGRTGVGSFGDGQFCEDQEYNPTQNGTFTINGEGEFLYYYATGLDPSGDPYEVVPPPNLVFS